MASFLPKVFPNTAGSGCHVHMSIWDKKDKNPTNLFINQLDPTKISQTALYFIAGILKHIRAITAITTPSNNSFFRHNPGCLTGMDCWGYENRDCAIRVAHNHKKPCDNVELKTFDHTANPYLGLACVLAAGLEGI